MKYVEGAVNEELVRWKEGRKEGRNSGLLCGSILGSEWRE
jgi:hypothetical protein